MTDEEVSLHTSKRRKIRKLDKLHRKIAKIQEQLNYESSPNSNDENENVDPVITTEAQINHTNDSIVKVLGKAPTEENDSNSELHEEIAVRWRSFLIEGIKKEERSEALEKYSVPENCIALQGPTLNQEMQTSLPEDIVKQDKFFISLQTQIGKGLMALAIPINKFINEPAPENTEMVNHLANAGKILCDVHHAISGHRRYVIGPQLKFEIRKAVEKQPIGEKLFQANLQEEIKNAEALKQVGNKIAKTNFSQKVNYSYKNNNYPSQGPKRTTNNLNYQRPYQKYKFKNNQYKNKQYNQQGEERWKKTYYYNKNQ
ncbi:unnamed protein product [Brassicogethes aeneus]|uniref:Uncharacterized protein n=1 Tax=Brassicogethes aeneus TaxID=1431903 RepID=A0A9P0FGF0_BRAAE|nr:unnamed protein product [Brassicogethes aeneus]